MCQDLRILAQSSESRLLCSCEHGRIHLVWDGAAVTFSTEVLQDLDILLDHAIAGIEPEAQPADMSLFTNEAGFWVQIRYFAIRLSWDDLAEMAEMTALAAEARESQMFPSVLFNHGDTAEVLFSLN